METHLDEPTGYVRLNPLSNAYRSSCLAAIECRSCTLDLIAIGARPIRQLRHSFQQCVAKRTKLVLHTRRNSGIYRPHHKTIALKTTQCVRQHPLRDAFDGSAKIAKALRTAAKQHDHEHTPLVAHAREHVTHKRTGSVVAEKVGSLLVTS